MRGRVRRIVSYLVGRMILSLLADIKHNKLRFVWAGSRSAITAQVFLYGQSNTAASQRRASGLVGMCTSAVSLAMARREKEVRSSVISHSTITHHLIENRVFALVPSWRWSTEIREDCRCWCPVHVGT